jgi:branched-chain amino acid transport system ATP-binding protein
VTALLEVEGLAKRFGGVPALDGATLEVGEGSITALIGPNGAGKTSLFNAVSGFLRPERGAVSFAGQRIDRLPPHRIAGRGLLRTFQTARALTRMSVLDNVKLAARNQPGERAWRVLATPRAVRRREREVERLAHELLELVRLDRHAADYAGTLSGGQRKLLDFARVLMAEPRMVLLDEPLAGVNPVLGAQLLDHVRELRESRGMTFLLIEHDLEAVLGVSERVIVMNEGRVIAAGAPAEVRADPRVVDAYLGAHA